VQVQGPMPPEHTPQGEVLPIEAAKHNKLFS